MANIKLEALYDIVYRNFITGKYGSPKIPAKHEIIKKIEELTSLEYVPILSNIALADVEIDKIRDSFSNAIDDISVLYDAIEIQSKEILDQLSNSLKEHRGIKRELKLIETEAEDVINGKQGNEYIEYNFTEKFSELTNINEKESSQIDIKTGKFFIQDNASRQVNLRHYFGKKFDIVITDYIGNIVESGYVGPADAGVLVDIQDDRQLIYKVKMNMFTKIKGSFIIQLDANTQPITINQVNLGIDSDFSGGEVRVFYRKEYEWKLVPGNGSIKINQDKIIFNFSSVKTSHIKVEILKDKPDILDTNEFKFILNSISILETTNKNKATVISKPIEVSSYNNEKVLINSISSSTNVTIPKGCGAKVFVAQDLLLPGAIVDIDDNIVDPKSVDAVSYNPNKNHSIFLSDLHDANIDIDNIDFYKYSQYNWKQLKLNESDANSLPKSIEFSSDKRSDELDSSLAQQQNGTTFGDTSYLGTYPGSGVTPLWFASGWCHTSNPNWSYLLPYVNQGIFVSGVPVLISGEQIEVSGALNPLILDHPDYSGQWLGYATGYPFDYSGINFVFSASQPTNIDGWWRPQSHTVTPSGITQSERDEFGHLQSDLVLSPPDFFFNGEPFYKIYRFNNLDNIVENTIKLYDYETIPNGQGNNYSTPFIWKTNEKRIPKTHSVKNAISIGDNSLSFSGRYLSLPSSDSFINGHITDFYVSNTSINLIRGVDYNVIDMNKIDISPLVNTYPALSPSSTTFDYSYTVVQKNNSESYWEIGAIVYGDNAFIEMLNDGLQITTVIIKTLDDAVEDMNLSNLSSKFKINLPKTSSQSSHYKVLVYTKVRTGSEAGKSTWNPKGNINFFNVRLVRNIDSYKIVNISSLVYGSSFSNKVASIINDNGIGYLVVKCPSKDKFPDYEFNMIDRNFSGVSYENKLLKNDKHFFRRYVDGNSIINYTTGASGDYVFISKDDADLGTNFVDIGWNYGSILTSRKNTFSNTYYPNYSTYKFPINVNWEDDDYYFQPPSGLMDPTASGVIATKEWREKNPELNTLFGDSNYYINSINRGFLYQNTAENLPSYYTISYKTTGDSKLSSRFLYKIELESESENLSPIVDAITFNINKGL